ncbi:MAG: oligosaccharide flippase family protein, partial [Gemmatimonadetes bacterium]|nr:oligosaccharide flippase family protein [Gemmatimonadota bacterium]
MTESLTRRVGAIGVSRIIATSVNVLVVNVVLSRALDQNLYGTFQQTWFFAQMLMELFLLGFPVAILYFLPKMTEPERKGFLSRALLILFAVGAVLAAGLWLGAPRLAVFFNNDALTASFRIIAWYALFALPGIPLDAFLITMGRHRTLGIVTILHSVFFVLAVLVPLGAGLPFAALIWGVVLYGLFKSGVLYGTAFHSVRTVEGRAPRSFWGGFVRYAIPVGLNDILRVVARWLDKTIVSAAFDPATFAIYANGAMEIPFVNVIAGSISQVVMPEMSKLAEGTSRQGLITLWHRVIRKTAMLLLPLFFFLFAFAVPLMIVLFSERYAASAGPFRLYLLLLPLRAATYTPILLALGRSKLVAWGALLDVLLNLGLSLALIPRFGYLGPAIATVVATYAQAGFYLIWAGRILESGIARVFPWRDLGGLMVRTGIPIVPAV